jgi:molybdopterin/thiamine biosynthesis adenylyltransferase/rhodanese-related sulfurtransferase
MPTSRELFARARAGIVEITPAEAEAKMQDANVIFLDVREADEHEQGTIPGAHHIPRGFLELQVEGRIPDRSAEVIIYCAGGIRSALAAQTMQDLGFKNVSSMIGGFNRWKDEGRTWSVPKVLTGEQRNRYHRHLLLPEVGEKGQQKLLESKVLLLGAGGLGSPAAMYLAAAGVGTLGIIDMDVVDASNLQRQILHNLDRIGDAKVDSAKRTITAMNPDVNVVPYDMRLGADNVVEIMGEYDLVLDGTDNFPTRYLVNDASLITGVPVVHGSIFRFEGQVTVFDPYKGPCYRCMVPEPPPPELAPSCAEAGVLGVLCGIIGSLEALEAIKMLLGLGDPLVGRLLSYDALEESFRTFKVKRDPSCPTCGPDAGEIVIAEYDQLCMPHIARSSEPASTLAVPDPSGVLESASV